MNPTKSLTGKPRLDAAESSFFADLQKHFLWKEELLRKDVSKICGVDAAYGGDRVVAVASLFDEGRLAETSSYVGNCSLPYSSGLFYLREGPFVVEAVRGLKHRPQLLCFDAHGAAHPRYAGLATICGMVAGIPSIGCAKSLLVGVVAPGKNGFGRVIYEEKVVGLATKWKKEVRYWSAGYSVSFKRLESVVAKYSLVCLQAMSESDRAARKQVREVMNLQL